MKNEEAIERTKIFVRHNMEDYKDAAHDWFHIERVWRMAKRIAQEERADMFIIEMAALLHDIGDFKFNNGSGAKKSRLWLESLGLDASTIDNITHIIENISFRGAAEKEKMKPLEGKIVQDADRLDAIGAFGIARAFAYAGHGNIPIFNSAIGVRHNMNFEQYRKLEKSAVNHFHEKLLLLRDRMNTKTGKSIAEGRHIFMETYLEQFFKEAEGER